MIFFVEYEQDADVDETSTPVIPLANFSESTSVPVGQLLILQPEAKSPQNQDTPQTVLPPLSPTPPLFMKRKIQHVSRRKLMMSAMETGRAYDG